MTNSSGKFQPTYTPARPRQSFAETAKKKPAQAAEFARGADIRGQGRAETGAQCREAMAAATQCGGTQGGRELQTAAARAKALV